jgi:hypothetical protein
MVQKCFNCRYYTYGYGLGGSKPYPDLYISCEFKKDIAKKCKENNYELWEKKDDGRSSRETNR